VVNDVCSRIVVGADPNGCVVGIYAALVGHEKIRRDGKVVRGKDDGRGEEVGVC
jgi:hypothetical protein